jgi:hypothetical protein
MPTIKTPGLDKILTNREKSEMVEKLREILIQAEQSIYKSTPVNRVMIPKASGKLIPWELLLSKTGALSINQIGSRSPVINDK